MTVQTERNIIVHEAVEGQDVFDYDFLVLNESDVLVFINEVPYQKGFQVQGVGNPSGGQVILDEPLTSIESGGFLTIVRIMPYTPWME